MDNSIPTTVDITALSYYLEKVKETASVSKLMAAVYLRDFVIGQDIAGQLVAKAVQADARAKAALEQAESIAYLDNAADYLKQREIKDSSEARKRYIDVDPVVIAAKDKKAQTEALVTLMKNKLSILRQAHDDLKKTTYGDQSGTSWEGM